MLRFGFFFVRLPVCAEAVFFLRFARARPAPRRDMPTARRRLPWRRAKRSARIEREEGPIFLARHF
ncbi:MAG: hypothetical protein DBX55_10335 [Verrucomicrobia bacterium]|nr:MAG: hypothetical protein DBX55_10335 [Verrucomicrobiota bacterium]